jgi:cytochrome c-type protein NapB
MRKIIEISVIGAIAASTALFAGEVIDINKGVNDPALIKKEDLGNKKVVEAVDLGLRKGQLQGSDVVPVKTDYSRPAPGSSKRFARAYVNAPPMIPHSVEGLLPITRSNNQCLGCHMPEAAKGVGATAIPASHFTDFRPKTEMKDGKIVKDGKAVNNTTDVVVAKFKKLDKLNPARYNCSQCHAPQANVKPIVGNTFQPEFTSKSLMEKSDLIDMITDGVK